MAFEAGRGGSGLEPKLAGLRLTPADFAGPRRRTPQDLGRILAGPGTGPSGPAVPGGPIHKAGLSESQRSDLTHAASFWTLEGLPTRR